MIKRLSKNGGFTLIEIIIVLAIIGMLAGILAPTLARYMHTAKLRRATEDVKAIGAAIGDFYNDLGEWPIWSVTGVTAGMNSTAVGNAYDVLRGSIGNDLTSDLQYAGAGFDPTNDDTLENQLSLNTPAYPDPVNDPNERYVWRGPYIEQFRADPWGNAYMVNVRYLWPDSEMNNAPVFVLSAGPDGDVQTSGAQAGPAFNVSGDDIAFRIK